jgi:phosphoglycerate kinase
MKPYRSLDDLSVSGKRILVRVDLNVPMDDGKVSDATRIDRALPTIRELANKNGKVILLSHFGRPKGGPDSENSLRPVAAELQRRLGKPVAFATDCIGEAAASVVNAMHNGDVAVLENTRFHKGEEKNDPAFVAELAKLGDLYVNDAFSAAHRAHASTEGIAHRLPAYAGRAMQSELDALTKALEKPVRPVMAVVGGAKVSSKLALLGNLVNKVNLLVIGGGMANTFLAAQGKSIGKSLCEKDLLDTARTILTQAAAAGCEIVLPIDAVVARQFKEHAPSHIVDIDHVATDEMILDIGPRSVVNAEGKLAQARTLVWNGPVGAFEVKPFDAGTVALAATAARLTQSGKLLSVAGGGDTVAALNQARVADDFSYVSSAGGAFLEWLEGKALPGVEALRG